MRKKMVHIVMLFIFYYFLLMQIALKGITEFFPEKLKIFHLLISVRPVVLSGEPFLSDLSIHVLLCGHEL